jgi:segregation and condensation protein B
VTPESIVEALLFSTDRPLPAARIAQILGIGGASDVKQHIDALNERYERTGSSFRIEQVAKGYQMLTLPPYNPWVGRLHKVRAESRLSGAALETLAIVAYKQPALRADIETIRGVAVGDMLVRLRDMNLVRIVGRAEEIGRPLLYGTTRRFLEVFGLSSLKDLPKLDPDRPDAVPTLRVVDESE